jgi:hypothetical protein
MKPENKVRQLSREILKYYRQGGTMYVCGQLKVTVEVINHDAAGTAGMRYTEDKWKTFQESVGSWSRHDDVSTTDQFLICSPSTIAPGTRVEYAIYYTASGATYWDNNGNYCAQF